MSISYVETLFTQLAFKSHSGLSLPGISNIFSIENDDHLASYKVKSYVLSKFKNCHMHSDWNGDQNISTSNSLSFEFRIIKSMQIYIFLMKWMGYFHMFKMKEERLLFSLPFLSLPPLSHGYSHLYWDSSATYAHVLYPWGQWQLLRHLWNKWPG